MNLYTLYENRGGGGITPSSKVYQDAVRTRVSHVLAASIKQAIYFVAKNILYKQRLGGILEWRQGEFWTDCYGNYEEEQYFETKTAVKISEKKMEEFREARGKKEDSEKVN